MPTLLEKIDFGHIEAEADHNLIRYFVETDSYDRIYKEKMYVIGRKGTGKSAICTTLGKLKLDWLVVSSLNFDDYPWQIHHKVKDESSSKEFAHVNTWKFIILLEIAKIVVRENPKGSKQVDQIKDFLNKQYGSLNPSFKEYLVDKVKRVKTLELPDISKGSFGKIDFETEKEPEKKLISCINILNSHLQDMLFPLLGVNVYFILFDKLDDAWDNSEDFKSTIVGLLRAARDINLEVLKCGKKLKCIPFLRSDIYDCLDYNDKNKAFPDIEFLNWSQDALKTVVNKRIAYYLQIPEEQAWDMVFADEALAKNTTMFNYMVKRSFLRPRDIIEFCNCAKQVAISKGHEKISKEDIYAGEISYSDYIIREFRDEIKKHYPSIAILFDVLRGIHYERFSFEEFEQMFTRSSLAATEKPLDALKILFEFSIIGVERIGGKQGGSGFFFKYQDSTVQPEFRGQMVIHPAITKHLNIIEKRKPISGSNYSIGIATDSTTLEEKQ